MVLIYYLFVTVFVFTLFLKLLATDTSIRTKRILKANIILFLHLKLCLDTLGGNYNKTKIAIQILFGLFFRKLSRTATVISCQKKINYLFI